MNSRVEETRYSFAERLFMLESSVWLLVVAVAVKTWGFRRCFNAVRRSLLTLQPAEFTNENRSDRVRRIAELVKTANGRLLPLPASCLVKSLVLYGLLRRRGLGGTLRLGVRNITGSFEAHAWVELDGMVIDEPEDVANLYEAFDPAFADGGLYGDACEQAPRSVGAGGMGP